MIVAEKLVQKIVRGEVIGVMESELVWVRGGEIGMTEIGIVRGRQLKVVRVVAWDRSGGEVKRLDWAEMLETGRLKRVLIVAWDVIFGAESGAELEGKMKGWLTLDRVESKVFDEGVKVGMMEMTAREMEKAGRRSARRSGCSGWSGLSARGCRMRRRNWRAISCG